MRRLKMPIGRILIGAKLLQSLIDEIKRLILLKNPEDPFLQQC